MATISISSFNNAKSNIETSCSNISTYITNMDTNFFVAMEGIWNSKRANTDVTEILTTVNSLIESVNKSLFSNGGSSALEALRATANSIATSELGTTVSELSGVTLSEISLSWSGVDDDYNYPSADYSLEDFANTTVVSELTNIVTELESIKGYMSDIENALDTSYVGTAIASINSTIDEFNGENGIPKIKTEITTMANNCDEERKSKVLEVSGN